MGNHMAGELINRFAAEFAQTRKPEERAIDILDRAVAAARATPGFTPDAEFEAKDPFNPGYVDPRFQDYRDPHPEAVLGMLMLEDFAPNGTGDVNRYKPMLGAIIGDAESERFHEEMTEAWWIEVNEPFRKRYGLC